MRKNYTFIGLLTLLFLWLPITSFAQMSDQQVMETVLKYQQSGMSQQQILLQLSKQGITATQLQRIQERIGKGLGSSEQITSNIGTSKGWERIPETEIAPAKVANDTIAPENKIFGQDFFSKENLNFSPNMNMPTPANYVLGPGDEVVIDVWGDSEMNARYTITPDGYITVSGLGRIQLSGLNTKQAESKIKNVFSSIFSGLDAPHPRTFLGVSVGNVRSIKVNVMGEVVAPGTYTLSSFSSAFHALYASGGPTQIGSLRNIHIFRGGNIVATIDLYEYLMKGSNAGDISLRDGDIVKVEAYGILAKITGQVKRPMRYEMRPNETIQDLIRYAGGFTGDAYQGNLLVYRKGSSEKEVHTLSETNYASFKLKDGDQVSVGNILDKYTNLVEITGAVYRPGKYAIGNQINTVRDLISVAQGVKGDAYLYRVLLYREQEDLKQIMLSFDLDALLNNRISDITLRKNDRLHIPSVFSLEDGLTVSIGGEVRAPGNYPYAENMKLEDIILQANGLKESASTARIDVFRRIRNMSGTTFSDISGQAFSFSLVDGKIISNDPTFILQPFDQVVVRRSPGYEEQQNVTIKGEVLFEGKYAKLQKDERLSSFIKRAGGLTKYAFIKGARLLRQLTEAEKKRTREALLAKSMLEKDSTYVEKLDFSAQPVGIDLEAALKNPGGEEDLVLKDGDELLIPHYEGTVKVSGAVLYPNTVTYNKQMTLRQYIKQAGGYDRLAMKRKTFVIYLNGQVATGRNAKIEPGCEIVVPERPEREPVSLQNILGISTTLASLALIISRFF